MLSVSCGVEWFTPVAFCPLLQPNCVLMGNSRQTGWRCSSKATWEAERYGKGNDELNHWVQCKKAIMVKQSHMTWWQYKELSFWLLTVCRRAMQKEKAVLHHAVQ